MNGKEMFFACICLVFINIPSWPIESTAGNQEKNTSNLGDLSTKPLKIYSARGRRDPFVASFISTVQPQTENLKITALVFVGFVSSRDQQIALFRTSAGGQQTLTLRAGSLYGSGNKPVANVSGRILDSKRVLLKQGEEKITFSVVTN